MVRQGGISLSLSGSRMKQIPQSRYSSLSTIKTIRLESSPKAGSGLQGCVSCGSSLLTTEIPASALASADVIGVWAGDQSAPGSTISRRPHAPRRGRRPIRVGVSRPLKGMAVVGWRSYSLVCLFSRADRDFTMAQGTQPEPGVS